MSQTLIPPPPLSKPGVRSTPLTDDIGPIKVNRQLRELFREAFDQLGGTQFLVEFALESEANRRVFVQAISKLLPASASPAEEKNKIILDIPWLTRDRLAYKEGALDSDVAEVLPIRQVSNGK
jgi:hypothetical protein